MFRRALESTVTLFALVYLAGTATAADMPSATEKGEKKYPFSVKFVDQKGQPVKDVTAGILGLFGSGNESIKPVDSTGWHYELGSVTGDDGIAKFEDGGDRDFLCVVGRHPERRLVGLWKIDSKLINAQAERGAVEINMSPECRVTGRLTCADLTKRGREVGRAFVRLNHQTQLAFEFTMDDGEELAYHFFIPPGEYELNPFGRNLHDVDVPFVVKQGQQELDVGAIEVPATRLALLEGLPAPKLQGIDAWKNGPAVDLEALKGKCVILEFWGYWCGPCVYRMPELFKMYDTYHAQGLEVIAIHCDLGEDEEEPVDTVAKLDDRLTKIRSELWGERDLPFPVGIVAGKRTPYHTAIEVRKARSPIVADYGVTIYPTMILIDPKGNVVSRFAPNRPEHIAQLEKMLQNK